MLCTRVMGRGHDNRRSKERIKERRLFADWFVAATIPGRFPQKFFKKQEKSRRTNAEGILVLSPMGGSDLFGYPQDLALFHNGLLALPQPSSLLLTTNHLGVGCGQKWYKVVRSVEVVGSGDFF